MALATSPPPGWSCRSEKVPLIKPFGLVLHFACFFPPFLSFFLWSSSPLLLPPLYPPSSFSLIFPLVLLSSSPSSITQSSFSSPFPFPITCSLSLPFPPFSPPPSPLRPPNPRNLSCSPSHSWMATPRRFWRTLPPLPRNFAHNWQRRLD